MARKLFWIGVVALITILAGTNYFQWRLRTSRLRVQDLPPAAAPLETEEDAATRVAVPRGAAKNLILLIGDGMGPTHVVAASIRRHGPDGRLHMERMPVTGLLRTEPRGALVTDSAAAATAMSTGERVPTSRVAMTDDGRPMSHLLVLASKSGRATGIVTTDEVTEATPAGFAAHSPNRQRHERIAKSLLKSPLDLLVGGGADRFDDDLRARAEELGWTVKDTPPLAVDESDDRILSLLAPGRLEPKSGAPSLAELTETALARLSRDPDGFVLVVEEALIDKRSHWWEGENATNHVLTFDDAVAVARRFAKKHPDTLVIATADHECGGLVVTARAETPQKPVVGFRTHGHSATSVPLFAEGPGAEGLTGVMHLAELNARLRTLLGLPE